MSYQLVLGSYVLYKGIPHIALAYDGNLVKLINPLEGNRKLNVKRNKVTPTNNRCRYVEFGSTFREYLVTAKGYIISLDTFKIMKWGDEHPERQQILSAARVYLPLKQAA